MRVNLFNLYELQKKLDNYINKKHKVTYKKTFYSRILGFIVEIGEFINETRCFKFWSLNKKISKQKVLEEYIDGLTFLVSIGIPLKFNKKIFFQIKKPKETDLTSKVLNIYCEAVKLINNYNFCQYKKILENYLEIICFLGFSLDEIIDAFLNKNKINYERQINNY